MSDFRVVNRSFSFTTKGEIDFIDLSDKVQEEVSASGIRNGLVHVFAPHATGILILTENDEALLEDTRAFLEEIVPKDAAYQDASAAGQDAPDHQWAGHFWNLAVAVLCGDRRVPEKKNRNHSGDW